MTAKFWRILISQTQDNGAIKAACAEMQMRTSVGGSNIATGGTATASSSLSASGDFSPSAAFDGNLSTQWACATDAPLPQWLSYELSTAAEVFEITLSSGDSLLRAARNPKDFKLQKSTNGTTWVDVKEFLNEPSWGVSETRTYFVGLEIVGSGNLVEISQLVVNDACNGFINSGQWDDSRQWCDGDAWQDYPIASGRLVEVSQNVFAIIPSHNINELAQTVARIGAGNLAELEQAVVLRLVGRGEMVSLGQSINGVASGNLARIAQRVQADTQIAAFDLELIVGDLTIPCNQIHGAISISRSESSAALMNVTLIPPKGAQNIIQYQGKSIILNYIADGNSTRIYTGKVDIPEVDILGQTITLRCTDNRSEQNNALPRPFVQGIGQYSEAVFGEAKDQSDEIEKRLRTVQASLDYDANGLVTYTSWTPKATADFLFDDASIYRRTPQVEVLSRGRVINKVNLDLAYRWVRLRHRERDWLWSYPFNSNSWCGYLADNIGLCPVDAPRRAAEGAGWSIKPTTYQTQPLPPSRWYRCTIGSLINAPIGWQTSSRVCESRNKVDENNEPVKDSEGNQVVEQVNCRVTDSQNAFAIRAEWTAARRWAQTVEQRVNYVITAPQSVNQYGVVERDERIGTEFDFDAQSWESMTNYQEPQGVKSPNGDWVIDQRNGGLGEFNSAVNCARAKAVADILGSHRQNYVTLQLPIQPQIDLRHTIETTAGKIHCKGKVYQIQHTIDVSDKFAETQIQIALSRAEGSTSTSLPSVSLPTTTDAPSTPSRIEMGTWVGGRGGVQLEGHEFTRQTGINLSDTTPAGLPKGAQGFITNYRRNRPQPLFTESFIVDTPAIEDTARDKLETVGNQSATLSIRNDLLEVVFDE